MSCPCNPNPHCLCRCQQHEASRSPALLKATHRLPLCRELTSRREPSPSPLHCASVIFRHRLHDFSLPTFRVTFNTSTPTPTTTHSTSLNSIARHLSSPLFGGLLLFRTFYLPSVILSDSPVRNQEYLPPGPHSQSLPLRITLLVL